MTLNVIFVCKTNDVLAVRKATADEQALDELKALPAEDKPRGADRCVSPPTKKSPSENGLSFIGGEAEIRTLGGIAPTTVFKTAALNHSATSPLALTLFGRFPSTVTKLRFVDDIGSFAMVARSVAHLAARRFQDRCIKPLCHLSKDAVIYENSI